MTAEDRSMQRIAKRLKHLRENEGLKQKDFAEILGVGLASYKSYETARRSIPTDVLRKAAVYFDCSMDYMSCLTDIPYSLKDEHEEISRAFYALPENDQARILERIMTLHEMRRPHKTLKNSK